MEMPSDAHSELEASLVELESALERGDITEEELHSAFDAEGEEESSEDESLMETSATITAEGAICPAGYKLKPRSGFRPTPNGWYVCLY
jgi:hypothetical protein